MREICAYAFCDCGRLRSVQLSEGLKKLGVKEIINGEECAGFVFANTAIESIQLPSTLGSVDVDNFQGCKYLKGPILK